MEVLKLFKRQKLLLHLLNRNHTPMTRIQLVKLCFLLRLESPHLVGSPFYDFLPYEYGPFSFLLYRELGQLHQAGYICKKGDNHFQLADSALLPFDHDSDWIEAAIEDIAPYLKLPQSRVVDDVYDRYPEFTVLSRRKQRGNKQTRPTGKPGVYTLGYTGFSIDKILNILIQNGINTVLDVRNNPVSRKYGFHKATLQRLCNKVSIEYVHIPELGISPEARRGLTEREDFEKLFKSYARRISRSSTSGLEHAAEICEYRAGSLLCAEANPQDCHRLVLSRRLESMGAGPTTHLAWPR